MGAFLKSNLVQIIITFSLGTATYISILLISNILARKTALQETQIKKSLEAITILFSIILSGVIFISFLFNLGETYIYSNWYKRSFSSFGDGFPFSLLLILNFGFYSKNRFLIISSLSAILMCGGKMVIVASAINITILHIFSKIKLRRIDLAKYLLVPLLVYFSTLVISNHVIPRELHEFVGQIYSDATNFNNQASGIGACENIDACIETQLNSAIKQRLATTAAGVWMTLEGGFPGKAYPGTAEKFADFMIVHDPYGMNEDFDLDRSFWLNAGAVQNPYFNFGSGYGPIGFFSILSLYSITFIVGLRQLQSNNTTLLNTLTVFLLMLALFNQTQPWIQSGSLLLYLSGISAAHIWTPYLLRSRNV